MTDRLKGFVVTLDREIRTDDAEPLIQAIRQLRGVLDVAPVVNNYEDYMNRQRVRHELGQKLWEVLYPKDKE